MSIHESFASPTSMFLRNLMAMETEEMVRAQPMDAVILIGGCDKTIPPRSWPPPIAKCRHRPAHRPHGNWQPSRRTPWRLLPIAAASGLSIGPSRSMRPR